MEIWPLRKWLAQKLHSPTNGDRPEDGYPSQVEELHSPISGDRPEDGYPSQVEELHSATNGDRPEDGYPSQVEELHSPTNGDRPEDGYPSQVEELHSPTNGDRPEDGYPSQVEELHSPTNGDRPEDGDLGLRRDEQGGKCFSFQRDGKGPAKDGSSQIRSSVAMSEVPKSKVGPLEAKRCRRREVRPPERYM